MLQQPYRQNHFSAGWPSKREPHFEFLSIGTGLSLNNVLILGRLKEGIPKYGPIRNRNPQKVPE